MSIVTKTDLGRQVMHDRSVSLTVRQHSVLILVDGKRSIADILKMTSAVGVTAEDVDVLFQKGLIDAAPEVQSIKKAQGAAAASALTASQDDNDTSAVDFPAALNAAITLCSGLGFKGFGLNMALTGVDSLEKLQKLAPEIRQVAGSVKYAPLHKLIFGQAA